MNSRLIFIHALSSLHAGTGQSFGSVDLTIAREAHTGFPFLPGSSLKGSLRALAFGGKMDSNKATALFGPDTSKASEHAGALAFGDAALLLMPIRSLRGTFAWVTSPYLVLRFLRDAGYSGLPTPEFNNTDFDSSSCQVANSTLLSSDEKVILEDLDLKKEDQSNSAQLEELSRFIGDLLFPGKDDEKWQDFLTKRLCLVHDDVMSFLSQYGTELITRNKLNSDKTVEPGALWDEENLPPETVLYSMAVSTPNKGARGKWGEDMTPSDVFNTLDSQFKDPIQLGGKATVGRGQCLLTLCGGGE
jgi:CRISPR-associated protein Cmr4